jgi:hypothetical protein
VRIEQTICENENSVAVSYCPFISLCRCKLFDDKNAIILVSKSTEVSLLRHNGNHFTTIEVET